MPHLPVGSRGPPMQLPKSHLPALLLRPRSQHPTLLPRGTDADSPVYRIMAAAWPGESPRNGALSLAMAFASVILVPRCIIPQGDRDVVESLERSERFCSDPRLQPTAAWRTSAPQRMRPRPRWYGGH